MIRTLVRSALLLVLAAGIALVWRSDRILFQGPRNSTQRYFSKIGYALKKHHGISFLVTFDEPHLVEWITTDPVNAPGTESVRGHIGNGRRFDGSKYTYIETPVTWDTLGERYTLSLWVNIKKTDHAQNICFTSFQQRSTGFRLRDGNLSFYVPDGEGSGVIVSYPFTAYGRFVHLAAVVEGPAGKVRLYENGVLKAKAKLTTVSLPSHNIEFGKSRWYTTGRPFVGILDDAAGWNRALSQKEINALVRQRTALPVTEVPTLYWRWKIVRGFRDMVPVALKMLDRFNPFLHESKLTTADLPDIQFFFSGKDARHFAHAHDRSLASGRRIERAANPRRIHAQYEGQTVAADLALDGSDTSYPSSKRPGYILRVPTNAPLFESRLIRFAPPETISNDLSTLALKSASAGLCRLSINGVSKGIYYYEGFDRLGVEPGDRSYVGDAPRHPANWPWLFRQPSALAPLGAEDRNFALVRLKELRRLLARDIFNPWSSREWRWRIRAFKQQTRPDVADFTSFSLLGTNPSPDYIVSDLDLSALRNSGVTWRSTRPEVIDNEGRVTRPETGSPIGVEFVAVLPDDAAPAPAPLHFRVMPRDRMLPALMLYSRDQILYNRRQEFHAFYYPAHNEGAPQFLTGGQATGGGIKHRGNTSYWRGNKRPMSLRFDDAVNLVGNTSSRYIYLLSGYVDTAKMRNKLVYDLFREWGGAEQQHYAPELTWTEVFLNGRYLGVWEMCTRVDGDALGFSAEPESPSSALYKIRASSALFTQPTTHDFDQVYPRPQKGRYDEPIQNLVAFTSQTPAPEFARGIEKILNLDNAIDFLLLLNFAGNVDGRTTNYYLGSDARKGGRFFFIPWDYDHTFDRPGIWLSNHLFNRLIDEYPGFMKRAAARWQELRRYSTSETSLDARLNKMAAQLSDYMIWEDRDFIPPEDPRFPDRVEMLRASIHEKLQWMDERFPAPDQAAP